MNGGCVERNKISRLLTKLNRVYVSPRPKPRTIPKKRWRGGGEPSLSSPDDVVPAYFFSDYLIKKDIYR